MTSHPIHSYRPQRTAPEDLEAIFVGREYLLEEMLGRLKDWIPGASRQHYLIIGPRGIGKTNLLTLIAHRIERSPELNAKWVPLAIAEDTYGITRIGDLLIESVRILGDKTGESIIRQAYDRVRRDYDEARVIDLTLDAFRHFHKSSGRGIVLMVENLNRLLERQIKQKAEIHLLRKILIEEDWLITICTSPTYLNAVTQPEEPLFEFFKAQLLSELTQREQFEMLKKRAALEENIAFEKYLSKFRSRLRALYHFTGGNPRLTIMLYDLVSKQDLSGVTMELDLLLDQLTPFYQDRMKDIPEQQAKLLEAMALMPEGCTPTELAEQVRMASNQVRALLTRLAQSGYVRAEERQLKKTVYIIPERFFRIWHQMNHSRATRGRIQYLLEFFASWYATKEERDQIWEELAEQFEGGSQEGDEKRLEDLAEYMNYLIDVSEGSEKYEREFDRLWHAMQLSGIDAITEELTILDQRYREEEYYFIHKGYFCANLEMHEAALRAFQMAIELREDDILSWFNAAVALDKLRRYREAREAYNQVVSILSNTDELEETHEVKKELLQILREGTDRRMVKVAAYTLGRTADTTIAGEVIAVLQASEDSWRRQHCATVLGLLRAREAEEVLIKYLSDEANNVRGSAATALGRIGSEQAVIPLIEALRDGANDVRGSAANALGRIGSEQAVIPLIEALRDEANNVRGSAATALGRIGSQQAVMSLIEALHDEASNVRGSAANALGRIGSEQAVIPLIEALRDEDRINRGSAARAIVNIVSERSMPDLAAGIDTIIKEVANLSQSKAIGIARTLLRSAFRAANLNVVREVLGAITSHLSSEEILWAPYMIAAEYLQSERDPAILNRQHPEMREAVQLLVDAFDNYSAETDE